MRSMDGIRSCKALPYYMPAPYYLPSSPKPPAFAPPFSANGVSVPPSVDSADFEDSHNSRYGYGSFSKPLGESYSEPFSKLLCGFSQGYSGFQSMDPLSPQLTRDTSPGWLSLDNLNTKPREIENPCQSPRVWNQILEFNKGHVEGSDDSGAYFLSKLKEAWNIDECNPAVYPPCWNGAPAAHYPVFGAYEPLHPELIDKFEEFLIASYLEGPKDFHVELAKYGRESCEISTKKKVQNEIGSQEKGFTGLVTKFPVSNSVSQACNSYGVVNDGRSGVGKQVIEENQFMSRNQNSLCRCRYVGFNVSGCLECSWSQEAANGLSSPPFMAGAPEKAPARAPAPKLDIQLLVQTMHNMSELLLDQCSTDEFQLNEQDRSTLENVIGNLRACTLIKDAEQIIPAQKRLFPELGTGNLGGQSRQLQQNSRVKEPHISKAMKSVFSENFREEAKSASHTVPYGNISVDVEADELCSLIYGAPFNQMMEVEKYSSKHGDNALLKGVQSKTEADSKLSPDQNSAEEVNSSHSAEHTSAMHAAANLTEPCGLDLSANQPIASENEGKGTQRADDYTVFSTNKEAEQDEANEEDVSNSGDFRALDMGFEGTDYSLNAATQDNSDADVEESDFDSTETLDSSGDADDEESDLDSEGNEAMQPSYGPRFGVEHVSSDDSSSDWELV